MLLQDQRDAHVLHPEPPAPHSSAKRGNLRMFFGGSAGFTAVRTMLETAAAAQRTGVDVVVGLVNSLGSCVIDHLLCGFECLPTLHGSRGAEYPARIDIEAVNRRRPTILLVDTRVLPSFETGRRAHSTHTDDSWADIEGVLTSGINVWAALDATGFSSWTTVAVGAPPRVSGLSLL